MDYKYIEQLLERYWQSQTTQAEETILQLFFSQPTLPEHLRQYATYFRSLQTLKQAHLDSNFDDKIIRYINTNQPVKLRKTTPTQHLTPLYKAAAIIATIFILGNAAQKALHTQADTDDYHYETYNETYNDVNKAYNTVSDALMILSQSLKTTDTDTLTQTTNSTTITE